MDIYIQKTFKGGQIEFGASRLNFLDVEEFENVEEGFFIDGEDRTDEIIKTFGEGESIQILIKDITPCD